MSSPTSSNRSSLIDPLDDLDLDFKSLSVTSLNSLNSINTSPLLNNNIDINISLWNNNINNSFNNSFNSIINRKQPLNHSNDHFLSSFLKLSDDDINNTTELNKTISNDSLQRSYSNQLLNNNSIINNQFLNKYNTHNNINTPINQNYLSSIKSSNTDKSLYKTELCNSFITLGYCPYNEKCQFAHGLNDLKSLNRDPKWKTKLCKNWSNSGYCRYGKRCCYKHGENDQG